MQPQSPAEAGPQPISAIKNWWVLLVVAALILTIYSGSRWLLNYVHVFSAILWTGTDIFMGFILGPIMRKLDLPTRRAVISRLMPKMIFYMPTMAIVTTTAGYYLAARAGYLALPYPQAWWVIATFAIVIVMIIQGFGILLPTNIRVYLEMQKDAPDGQKIGKLMALYTKMVASQALLQFAIILIMARFVTGF